MNSPDRGAHSRLPDTNEAEFGDSLFCFVQAGEGQSREVGNDVFRR
jgi:hypothetical protein